VAAPRGGGVKAPDSMRWAAVGLLGLGAMFVVGVDTQRSMPLAQPLDESIPAELGDARARDVEVSAAELQAVGVDDYLMRSYEVSETEASGHLPFTLYVGYYAQQMQGRTIHSPKNCLPGAGWEALTSETAVVPLASGAAATVNQYILQRGDDRALVLYWYQGRGRVAWNEYTVKFDLLKDAALRQRSDEALVRIVVPVGEGGIGASKLRAIEVAQSVVPALNQSLPS
jgi:EpsI family protein